MATPMSMTAYDRSARARGAALARSSQEDGREISRPARQGYWAKFERQVEAAAPGLRQRDPAEFMRRVKAASAAFMAPIQAKAVAARRQKAQDKRDGCPQCLDGGKGALCGRHAANAKRAEARRLNKEPQAPEAATLREKVARLEAAMEQQNEMLEYLIRREIAEQAGPLTDLIMASVTRDMRAVTPDELRAADRDHAA